MTDENSDWISLEAAVTYVEGTLCCYRENARELVRKAVKSVKVKSRTLHSSPKWLVSVIDGREVFHSDHGESIEICRKGLLEFFSKRQNDGPARTHPRPISDNVELAIKELWPDNEIPRDATLRTNPIHDWLISRRIIDRDRDVTRTIQRVFRERRGGQK